jgi:hypothetical protein
VAMDSYMGITFHYIVEEWFFRSIVLETIEIHESHMTKNISDLLEEKEINVI